MTFLSILIHIYTQLHNHLLMGFIYLINLYIYFCNSIKKVCKSQFEKEKKIVLENKSFKNTKLSKMKTIVLLLLFNISGCLSYERNTNGIFSSLVNHGQGSWNKHMGHRPVTHKKSRLNGSSCHDMNSEFKMCCSGVLQGRKGSASMCCGFQSYDAVRDICCHGLIHRKTRFNSNCNIAAKIARISQKNFL